MTTEHEYAALRKLHETTNESVRDLEVENAELRTRVQALEEQRRQWEVERGMQGRVVQEALARANAMSAGYLAEVERLRTALREARG